MEDGQLSDSDSDMTVVPSDRPLQMAVSERARGGRDWTARGAREASGRDAVSRRPRGLLASLHRRASLSCGAPTSPN